MLVIYLIHGCWISAPPQFGITILGWGGLAACLHHNFNWTLMAVGRGLSRFRFGPPYITVPVCKALIYSIKTKHTCPNFMLKIMSILTLISCSLEVFQCLHALLYLNKGLLIRVDITACGHHYSESEDWITNYMGLGAWMWSAEQGRSWGGVPVWGPPPEVRPQQVPPLQPRTAPKGCSHFQEVVSGPSEHAWLLWQVDFQLLLGVTMCALKGHHLGGKGREVPLELHEVTLGTGFRFRGPVGVAQNPGHLPPFPSSVPWLQLCHACVVLPASYSPLSPLRSKRL